MLKKLFNKIGWLTREQKEQQDYHRQVDEELYEWSQLIINDYKKYYLEKGEFKENDGLDPNNGYNFKIKDIDLKEVEKIASSQTSLNELKTHILDEIEKFKRMKNGLYGEDGITFYTTHSKPIQQHMDKKWDGGHLLDASGRTTLTELIGIKFMLETGERPHPDYRFSWEGHKDGSDRDEMRQYYNNLDF